MTSSHVGCFLSPSSIVSKGREGADEKNIVSAPPVEGVQQDEEHPGGDHHDAAGEQVAALMNITKKSIVYTVLD